MDKARNAGNKGVRCLCLENILPLLSFFRNRTLKPQEDGGAGFPEGGLVIFMFFIAIDKYPNMNTITPIVVIQDKTTDP